jgi:hypothetical protein
LTAVVQDLEESKSALEAKIVVQSTNPLKMDSGMRSNASNHSEVTKSSLRLPKMNTCQSHELKYTLLHSQEV